MVASNGAMFDYGNLPLSASTGAPGIPEACRAQSLRTSLPPELDFAGALERILTQPTPWSGRGYRMPLDLE